jgi:hypothetical protein
MDVDNGMEQTITLQEDVVMDNLFSEFHDFYPFQNVELFPFFDTLPIFDPNHEVTISNLPVPVESSPLNNSLIHKESLKKEILSLVDFEYRYNENFHYKDEVDFKSVLENCVISEIKSEILNCHLLIYYYRIGEFLDKVINELKDYLSKLHEQNIVTGLIKGTGIASSFKKIYKNYGAKESKKARNFFNKSTRVYKVYNFFPNPIIQMHRANKITANKLLKIGGKEWVKEDFEGFVQEIKDEVISNYEKYNLGVGVDFSNEYSNDLLVSNEILENVKKFSLNPSLCIEEI